jgi:hypothetical protein
LHLEPSLICSFEEIHDAVNITMHHFISLVPVAFAFARSCAAAWGSLDSRACPEHNITAHACQGRDVNNF